MENIYLKYAGWEDNSSWALAARVRELIFEYKSSERKLQKMGESGWVGADCESAIRRCPSQLTASVF